MITLCDWVDFVSLNASFTLIKHTFESKSANRKTFLPENGKQ